MASTGRTEGGGDRLVSLAAGVLPEFDPEDVVVAAAEAGFGGCGVWFDAESWDDRRTRTVGERLDHHGIVALDMEPVFVGSEGDHGEQLVDTAAEIGARHVLTVSRGLAIEPFADRFAELCDRAAPAGIIVVVEFTRLYTISTLLEAVAVLERADRPNAGILVDNLHLDRCGLGPADLEDVQGRLPYVQLSDADAADPNASPADLLAEARDGRRNLGEGELPLREFMASVPAGAPVSLEIRSAGLRRRFPDPTDRAAAVLTAYEEVFGTTSDPTGS